MTGTRQNLTVTGSGGSGGGLYKDVKVNGEAQFNGDIDCLGFRCNGTAIVYGTLKGTSCTINGTLEVAGDLDTGMTKVNGKMDVDGNMKAREIKSFGETNVRGNVAGEEVGLEGYFNIKGHCEAEQLRIKGIFRIGGLVNAGSVEFGLHSRCEVKEIGGERIQIRRAEGNVLKKLFGSIFLPSDFYEGTLTVDTIEGDEIYVEHTTAHVIRGASVIVGPGCRIGRIEFTDRFENDAGSTVEQYERV
ncbi:MAG: bactofilin [Paenibacillus sp.]|nr:bactofilin [Paenibacillus sp.]